MDLPRKAALGVHVDFCVHESVRPQRVVVGSPAKWVLNLTISLGCRAAGAHLPSSDMGAVGGGGGEGGADLSSSCPCPKLASLGLLSYFDRCVVCLLAGEGGTSLPVLMHPLYVLVSGGSVPDFCPFPIFFQC